MTRLSDTIDMRIVHHKHTVETRSVMDSLKRTAKSMTIHPPVDELSAWSGV